MNFGIVAFPSKDLQDLANTYRKRYDPHFSLIAPHITLKDAFTIAESEVDVIIKSIKEIAHNTAPLKIHASRTSSFYPITNAIFFRVEPTEQLSQLQQSLQKNIAFGELKHVFVPHITIAQKLTDGEHDDIFGQLRMIGVDQQETIDSIHLVYQLEDGTWSIKETFKLDGNE